MYDSGLHMAGAECVYRLTVLTTVVPATKNLMTQPECRFERILPQACQDERRTDNKENNAVSFRFPAVGAGGSIEIALRLPDGSNVKGCFAGHGNSSLSAVGVLTHVRCLRGRGSDFASPASCPGLFLGEVRIALGHLPSYGLSQEGACGAWRCVGACGFLEVLKDGDVITKELHRSMLSVQECQTFSVQCGRSLKSCEECRRRRHPKMRSCWPSCQTHDEIMGEFAGLGAACPAAALRNGRLQGRVTNRRPQPLDMGCQ